MALLNLPCEILLTIAEQCDDPRDILSFACVTHTTYRILRNLVYQSCARQRNCTALHYAAKYNNHDVAGSLLGYGANINSTLKSSTALLVAAAFGSETVIDLLLARKDIDVNARNMHGETALWHAVYAGRMCAVTRLLQRQDLDIDVTDTFHKMTPFTLAVAHGLLDIAKILLDSDKVDINVRDNRGRTPLHHAVISEQKESTLLLLSRRQINVNMRDKYYCTPLWYAVDCGNLDAAQLLIMHSANPNTPSSHQITPLHRAIWGRNIAMMSLLLDQNDLELSPCQGWEDLSQSPVIAAVCVGDIRILEMLLRRGARVNIFNYHGHYPLQLAVRRRELSMVKLLLNHQDTDVNQRDRTEHGFTALHHAAYDGCLPIVNILLGQADVDINARDADERTPLWWAVKNGHSLVVNRLLAENDLDFSGIVEGQPPLLYAIDNQTRRSQRQRMCLTPRIPIKTS